MLGRNKSNGSVSLPLMWEGATTLAQEDIDRIADGSWLTENIIDAFLLSIFPSKKPYHSRRIPLSPIFLELLTKRGPIEVSEWITQPSMHHPEDRLYGVNLFKDVDVVAIPYNMDNIHWVTLIINLKDKKIQMFDSIERAARYKVSFDGELIKDFLLQEYERIYGDQDTTFFDDWNFKKVELLKPEGVAGYQKDDNNCGVWVICFIHNFLRELGFGGLSGRIMKTYRQKLVQVGLEAMEKPLEVTPMIIKREFFIGGREIEDVAKPGIPKLMRSPSLSRLPSLCRQRSMTFYEALEEEYKRAKAKRLVIEENQAQVRAKVLEIQKSMMDLLHLVENMIPKDIELTIMEKSDEIINKNAVFSSDVKPQTKRKRSFAISKSDQNSEDEDDSRSFVQHSLSNGGQKNTAGTSGEHYEIDELFAGPGYATTTSPSKKKAKAGK